MSQDIDTAAARSADAWRFARELAGQYYDNPRWRGGLTNPLPRETRQAYIDRVGPRFLDMRLGAA
jgi:hypothetical protein